MRMSEKYCLPISSRDTDELKIRITADIQTADSAVLHRTWLKISYMLRTTNGAHIAKKVHISFIVHKETVSVYLVCLFLIIL